MKRRHTCESCLPGIPCVLHSSGAPFIVGDDEAETPPARRRDVPAARASNEARLGKVARLLVDREDA